MTNRFSIYFQLSAAGEHAAESLAEWICLEQSAELPADVLSAEYRNTFCGHLVRMKQISETVWETEISFPVLLAEKSVSQFLNVLFGNISIGDGIRITGIDWHKWPMFKGPKFGVQGVREALGVFGRPLSCTALKPVGLSAGQLGKRCFEFSKAGIDLIKDDHGLADQMTAPFSDRLKACQIAIKRAYEESGNKGRYFPNVTADGETLIRNFEAAAAAGCEGVLISPHLIGLDRLRELRNHKADLMIMAHPAFSGTLTGNEFHGLSHRFLYGELWRALGADFCIYPNTGGRFPYTPEICASINEGCRDEKLPFASSFPTPGGGIQASQVEEWIFKYGNDTVFLIGGSLYRSEEGVGAAAARFSGAVRGIQ